MLLCNIWGSAILTLVSESFLCNRKPLAFIAWIAINVIEVFLLHFVHRYHPLHASYSLAKMMRLEVRQDYSRGLCCCVSSTKVEFSKLTIRF